MCEWYNTPLIDENDQVVGVASLVQDVTDTLQSHEALEVSERNYRTLAEAIVSCGTTGLDESKRTQLARHLYGITVIGDDRSSVNGAIIGIQHTMAAAGPACGPAVIDRAVNAARAVASVDPNPRRNWW